MAIVFILIVVVPSDSRSNVIISDEYPISVSSVQNCIKYQMNDSLGPLINLNKSTIGPYGDNATLYINSTWWSGIASDNSGNTFYVDTRGDLFENFSKNVTLRYLGTPYSEYAYYGPVVGLAVSNNSISEGGALVQELTEWGAVFELNVTNANTISNGWYGWILPHSGIPSTIFSSIAELKSVNYYREIFMYFAVNGTIYYYYPDNGPENNVFYILTYDKSPAPFVSATCYAYVLVFFIFTFISFEPFGLLYNGSVYLFLSNGWHYFGTTVSGARAINEAPSNNHEETTPTSKYYFYLMVILLKNNTYVYLSNQLTYSSSTGSFSAISIPTTHGTNEAVFNPWGYGWYVLQTNGTIAHSSSWNDPTNWNYFSLPSLFYHYKDVLNITDSCTTNFTVFASFQPGESSQVYSMHYFNLTFYNYTKKNRTQFIFNMGSFTYAEEIINVSESYKIFINITFSENKAYNATFYFIVYTYPQGNNNIIIGYQLKIVMVDHFSFIPI